MIMILPRMNLELRIFMSTDFAHCHLSNRGHNSSSSIHTREKNDSLAHGISFLWCDPIRRNFFDQHGSIRLRYRASSVVNGMKPRNDRSAFLLQPLQDGSGHSFDKIRVGFSGVDWWHKQCLHLLLSFAKRWCYSGHFVMATLASLKMVKSSLISMDNGPETFCDKLIRGALAAYEMFS